MKTSSLEERPRQHWTAWDPEMQPGSFTGVAWPPDAKTALLRKGEIHVWAMPLQAGNEEYVALQSTLDPSEMARAARFRFAVHQNRFTVGRGRLRHLLGFYGGENPRDIRFQYGAAGKPEIETVRAAATLHFNFTHSDDLGLCAVTLLGPVGIDCERVRELQDAADLVARFFSPRENVAFAELAKAEQPEAFFNLWTRKEAILKGAGEGIAHALNRVEVSFLPGESARLVSAPARVLTQAWVLYDVCPRQGYVAALATGVRPWKLRLWRWLE